MSIKIKLILPKYHRSLYIDDVKKNKMSNKSIDALMKLQEIAKKKNVTLLTNYYTNYRMTIYFQCMKGHQSEMKLDGFKNSKSENICGDCRDDKRIEEKMIQFKSDIKAQGGRVIGKYIDNSTKIECECSAGHKCFSYPYDVSRGGGMCAICAGRSPAQAKEDFFKRIKELGGEVKGEYICTKTPTRCICKNGHECFPAPGNVKNGHDICRICTGCDNLTAKKNFENSIKLLGGTLVGEYINSPTKVECTCKNGHQCFPIPSSIQQGRGMCPTCSKERLMSKGASNIKTYLDDNKFDYEMEVQLEMITQVTRRYDFVLEKHKIIIEFDGQQHFDYSKGWHDSKENFEMMQERDRFKTYCGLLQGYTFVRIYNNDHKHIAKFLDHVFNFKNRQSLLFVDDVDKYKYLFDKTLGRSTFEKSTGKSLTEKVNLNSYLYKYYY